MKTSYEGLKAGDIATLDQTITCDGRRLEPGTTFTIIRFPPKVRKIDPHDINAKGHQPEYFIYGETEDKWPVRALLCEIDLKNVQSAVTKTFNRNYENHK